jgi:MFS family permease
MDAPLSEKRKLKLPVFTFGELLSATLRSYRQSFPRFILPVALYAVIATSLTTYVGQNIPIDMTTFQMANQTSLSREQAMALLSQSVQVLGTLGAVSLIVSLVQSLLLTPLITWLASEAYLGRKATLGQAVSALRSRFISVLGGLLVYYLLIVLLLVALTLVFFLCGLGLGLVGYVTLALGSLLIPVLLLERVGIGEGLRRGWFLAKRRFWMLFGIAAIFTVISYVVGLAIPRLVGTNLLLSVISQVVFDIVLMPFLPIAYTLVYYDARVRFEDLEGELTRIEKPDPRPADIASPVYNSNLMEGSDFANLAIMVVLMFIVVLVLVAYSLATGGARAAF